MTIRKSAHIGERGIISTIIAIIAQNIKNIAINPLNNLDRMLIILVIYGEKFLIRITCIGR
jgi:hypothetical protein